MSDILDRLRTALRETYVLDRHFALMAQVVGEVHRRHAAGTKLALDAVAGCEGGNEVRWTGHVIY